MTRSPSMLGSAVFCLLVCVGASAQNKSTHNPTWWAKYQYLAAKGASQGGSVTSSLTVGSNVDVSNECGPQSETFITVNPARPKVLAAGSNEIFRDPMRGYFSADGGATWGGVDAPLPPPLQGTHDIRFGSDPSLAFDTRGNLFYSYIVVFFGGGNGVDGSQMAVARSTDGGQTYSQANFFSFQSGSNHFNDKPMIVVDTNTSSPFRDNVYVPGTHPRAEARPAAAFALPAPATAARRLQLAGSMIPLVRGKESARFHLWGPAERSTLPGTTIAAM
jgi:hypothetical protein